MTTNLLRRVSVLLAALILPLLLLLVQFQIVNSYASETPDGAWPTDATSAQAADSLRDGGTMMHLWSICMRARVAYDELEHVTLTRMFLNNPNQFLQHL